MFTRPLLPARFLRAAAGTAPFEAYCRARGIDLGPGATPPRGADARRWEDALAALPEERRAQVEMELLMVDEMSGGGAGHLLEASDWPAPPADVPGGAPLALWFLVNAPEYFREVFFQHEVGEVECWRVGQASPEHAPECGEGEAAALAEALRCFFALHEGGPAFCTAEAHRLGGACCFAAHAAARPELVEAFSDAGRPTRRRLRRALPVLFVYRPGDGAVLLKSPLRSRERVAGLFELFGRAVLGAPVSCGGNAFALDGLKHPVRLPADAPDMLSARVKALHLRYPDRHGPRVLKLETPSGDGPRAIQEMLAAHVRPEDLPHLRVCFAEIQVMLLIDGRPRSHPVRLWPGRSSLGQSPLGERLRACLSRWGLLHARLP